MSILENHFELSSHAVELRQNRDNLKREERRIAKAAKKTVALTSSDLPLLKANKKLVSALLIQSKPT